jgi:tRNA(Ile)-lysidine synthase
VLERVAGFITRYNMFERGCRVAVAVSGGADSVCLLYALVELAPRWNLKLRVLHLNHKLRGEESRQDAEFVQDLALKLGLPMEVREADLAASSGNLEQAARNARLTFFGDAIATGGVDRVATGHTRSDQAETVLFRFLRGSGTAGLAGIRPVTSEGVVRPLLGVERSETVQFLHERGIPWREDSSNASPRFARNRIRHKLLPQLAHDWNPALTETLANTADWALAEEAWWEAEIDRLAAAHLIEKQGGVLVPTHALNALPVAVARRLIRRAMERVKGDLRGIDFRHISEVLAMASAPQGHGRTQAPGLDILRSFEWLRFSRPLARSLEAGGYRVPVQVPGTIRLPAAGIEIHVELLENAESPPKPGCVCICGYNKEVVGCVDWDRVSGALELRNWRPGDQYTPHGSAGEEKIKTFFQKFRVPVWERKSWPLLTSGSGIVWARRFGTSVNCAVNSASKRILQIRES